jgi:hypothetical protein
MILSFNRCTRIHRSCVETTYPFEQELNLHAGEFRFDRHVLGFVQSCLLWVLGDRPWHSAQ